MSLPDRLWQAIQQNGHTPHSWQQSLDRRVQGTSYPSIHGYLSGKSEPGLEFLAYAARTLGVSPGWLAFGTVPDAECPRCAMHEHRIEKAIAVLRDG